MSETESTHRLNLSASVASVGTALFLVALKAWAVAATGALSVAASLADSALDLLASGAGLLGIIYAAKPPDDDHSFGHTSIEDLVALGQAILVAVSAGLIGWNAILRLRDPRPLEAEAVGLAVMAVAIICTIALVLWQGRVARRTGSKIVAADRLHYLADLLPNLGAIIALSANRLFGIGWLDPVIALMACGMLLYGARNIGIGAFDSLMDRRADPAIIAEVGTILDGYPGIEGFHDLRTRTSGSRLFVQAHVELDGSQTLFSAHEIAAGVRAKILSAFPGADVIIHQDPRWPAERSEGDQAGSESPR